MGQLILKRECLSPFWPMKRRRLRLLSLSEGEVVGRIAKVIVAPEDTPWMWTLAYGHHRDRSPTHGVEATRGAAMVAFAKSWRRQ
jgi:hypothetical protein